jgi:hypothetical protein
MNHLAQVTHLERAGTGFWMILAAHPQSLTTEWQCHPMDGRACEGISHRAPSQTELPSTALSIEPVAHLMFLPIPKYGHGQKERGCLLCKALCWSPDNATSLPGHV